MKKTKVKPILEQYSELIKEIGKHIAKTNELQKEIQKFDTILHRKDRKLWLRWG